jgi:hypothetical protein
MAQGSTVLDYALELARAGTAAILVVAIGCAPNASNRTGYYADLSSAGAEELNVVVGAVDGASFLTNGSDLSLILQTGTRDGIALAPRGGTTGNSYLLTITSAALGANRTATFPDADITVAGSNFNNAWSVTQAFAAITATSIGVTGATTSTQSGGSGTVLDAFVGAEGTARFNINGSGTHTWGSGSATRDCTLSRSTAGVMRFEGADSGTTSVLNVFNIAHNTSGPAANGFGVAIQLSAQTSTTSNTLAGRVIADWTTATHATRTSRIVLEAVSSGSATTVATFTPALSTIPAPLTVTTSVALGTPSSDQVNIGNGRISCGGTGATSIQTAGGVTCGAIAASGIITYTNTTEASSTSVASVVLSGGLGIAKRLRIGGGIVVLSGSANPYFDLNDGTGSGYFQVVSGDINLTPRATKGVVLAGSYVTLSPAVTCSSSLRVGTTFRIDQTPVAATPTPTHTITINFNGTDYRIPCVI